MLLVKLTIFATLLFGLLSSFIVSRRLAKPVASLSDEVEAAQQNQGSIPNLSETGIRELDKFSTAITGLSREVLNTSTKFLWIMEMASVEIGGYELRFDTGSVFIRRTFLYTGNSVKRGAPHEYRKIQRDFKRVYRKESL